MAEEQRPPVESERRGGSDRREEPRPSAWADPKLWVSICGLLLTLTICLFGYISSQLSTLVIASTRNDMRVQALEQRVNEQETWRKTVEKDRRDDDKRFNDYQYSVGKALGELKGQMDVQKEKR